MISLIKDWRRRVGRARLRKLAIATKKLYSSPHPFEPVRQINKLQRALPLSLPSVVKLLVPTDLRDDAGLRVQEILYAEATSNWMQEAILTWADSHHKLGILYPPGLTSAWNGAINKPHNLFLFLLFVAMRFKTGIQRYWELCKLAFSGPQAPQQPYVIALNTPAGTSRYADQGGILPWLKHQAPFCSEVKNIWVNSRFLSAEDHEQHPEWVDNHSTPFPRIEGIGQRIGFYLHGGSLIILSGLLSILGAWQAAALLSDLVGLAYFKRAFRNTKLIGVASFLGDMPNRFLWICYAEKKGITTPLIYFASSYTLFHYGPEPVDDDLVSPVLLMNHWKKNWHQTQDVSTFFTEILRTVPCSQGKRQHTIVGAFDMIHNGQDLTSLPKRSVAIFDIEPSGPLTRLSMAGYIYVGSEDSKLLLFWQCLAELAEELELVLVHKVKRRSAIKEQSYYFNFFENLKNKGRYVVLNPDVGVQHLLEAVPASVCLPFTSVCDVAKEVKQPSIYFDCLGVMPNPEIHAMGSLVAQGKDVLRAWLLEQYGPVKDINAKST